ncbi:MAG: cysteine desulfurase family protein [Micrococcales bacterium]
MIYLDHAATTPVNELALRAAWPFLTQNFGNPNSSHEVGKLASEALEGARQQVAAWLGCRASEVVFTSGGTESNNLAIKGIALSSPRGRHIISARTEHESVLQPIEYLVRHHGFEVSWLPIEQDGSVTVNALLSALRPDTTLVTLMLSNNEIGTIHDIQGLAATAKAHGVRFHTDAVQAAGWLNCNVSDLGVQALSLSGHKFGAPKGVGILYLSDRIAPEPVIHGGGQESERRSGTQNVAWAVAVAEALGQLPSLVESDKMSGLRDAFIAQVQQKIPEARLTGSTHGFRHPAHASFVFPRVNGETLLLELEHAGVICSSGSACAAGSTEPSHVLTGLGLDADLAQTAIRFSFGHDTTAQELETAAELLAKAWEGLKG